MKPILTLMLLALLPVAGSAQYLLLQSGFSDGSVRSSNGNYFLEQCSGVPFGGLSAGGSYLEAGGFYPIGQLATGVELPQDTLNGGPALPKVLTLCQPYPNPGRASTVRFGLPAASQVSIRVYNILGQQVRILLDGGRPAGWHVVRWDARDQDSRSVVNGVYVVRLIAGKQALTKRLMVLR